MHVQIKYNENLQKVIKIMKYRSANSIASHGLLSQVHSGSRRGQNSLISMTSKKQPYSIQSIPHQLVHAKNAFKDYFRYQCMLDDEVSQENSYVSVHESNTKKSKLAHNPYAQMEQKISKGKKLFVATIQKLVHKKKKEGMDSIKKVQYVEKTAQKLPTFRDSSIKNSRKVDPEENYIQITQKLVGRISRQNVDAISRLKTASKLKFSQKNSQIKYEKYIPIVNKLLLIEGVSLLQRDAIELGSNLPNSKVKFSKSIYQNQQ